MILDLIVSDVSNHRVARTHCVGEVLSLDHEVRYWGMSSQGKLWGPLAKEMSQTTIFPVRRLPAALGVMREMAHRIDGDVLYAFKPLVDSFGLALLARRLRPRPLILDIDDWEWAFSLSKGRLRVMANTLRHVLRSSSPGWVWLMERLIPKADTITTVSTVFQQRYGGVLLPHGRDPVKLDPSRFDLVQERSRLGLPQDQPVLLFLGTPRAHKGLEELMDAVMEVRRTMNLFPFLVGGELSDPFVKSLVSRTGGILRVDPMCPFREVPRYLAASNLVVLPQREDPRSLGQVPAKLFDAMAMARPIVATAVSEIPRILGDCGWIVPPGEVAALTDAISQILLDPVLARNKGEMARKRFVDQYSYPAMRTTLDGLLKKLVSSRL